MRTTPTKPNADELPPETNTDSEKSDNATSTDTEDEEVTGPDPIIAKELFNLLDEKVDYYVALLGKHGNKDPRTIMQQQVVTDLFLKFKLNPKLLNKQVKKLRDMLNEIRLRERNIMRLCIQKSKTPRKSFIASFPTHETDFDWLDSYIESHPEQSSRNLKLLLMKSKIIKKN